MTSALHKIVSTLNLLEEQGETKHSAVAQQKVRPSFVSNESSPIALSVLQDIGHTIQKWQRQLSRVKEAIVELYQEGPIVNGWLECHYAKTVAHQLKIKQLSHRELIDIYQAQSNGEIDAPGINKYFVCGFDKEGNKWSKPCDQSEIVPMTIAIARCHRLRQLLQRKKELEENMAQVAENLVVVKSLMQ
jgi:hypothetical protein